MDSSAALRQASWGFCLLSAKTGKVITNFRSEKSFVPASVQKVMTTAAGLALLGDTFRFKTRVIADGQITKEGILNGNLIVKGGGDPVTGSEKGSEQSIQEVIQEFAQTIQAKGIKAIKGKLIGDVSYFEYEPVPAYWTWFDIGNYYAPNISALNINENQYELWFRPGKEAGDSTKFIKAIPVIPGMTITNHTITAIGGGDQTYLPGPPRSMDKHIYGKLPAGEPFKVKGAIPQPELFFLHLLRDELEKVGITISEGFFSTHLQPTIRNPQPIHTHYSPPLSQLCQFANYTSNNLAVECLLRTLGAEKGKLGSTAQGIEVLESFLKTRIVDQRGLKIVDGSGCSKFNLISPSQLASFLYAISKENWSKCFINTLPTAGASGTLEKFCNGKKAAGRVLAKSGTMERIKCYAGYIKDKQGNFNPFAIMVNNHDVRNKEIVEWIEGLMEVCIEL